MRPITKTGFWILCILNILFAFNLLSANEQAYVSRVIDGDTFVLSDNQKVRLVGIDCPESNDPNKPVEYFAEESKVFLESLIVGKDIKLEYGDERTDKYNRLLCYVWVDDTVLVNLEIIKQGYGMAYLRFPHKLEKQFLDAEIAARYAAIGMWASPRSRLAEDKPPVEKIKTSESKESITVYITKTGSKYHRGTCRYLSKSKIPISKEEAIKRGYGPCKVCKP